MSTQKQQRECAGHVQRSLELLKDKIGRDQDRWDAYKAARNPYEMVYAAPPCVASVGAAPPTHPTSRAFYKLWELVCDDEEIRAVLRAPGPKNFAYVAEAPGSFVEALVTFRRAATEASAGGRARDGHRGITLGSERRSVPHWKLQWSWMRAFDVEVSRGSDGTGDVTRPENIDAFVKECGGEGSCDMVTGDGGFDFSSNFNEQESQVTLLLAAEVLVAMRLLRRGGCAVVKMFDAFNPETVDLVGAFMDRFELSDIRKPKTSRPANSERYLVCTGYKGKDPDACRGCERYVSGLDPTPILRASAESKRRVAEANVRHGIAQIASIIDTFDAMDRGDQRPVPDLSPEWIRSYLPGHGH